MYLYRLCLAMLGDQSTSGRRKRNRICRIRLATISKSDCHEGRMNYLLKCTFEMGKKKNRISARKQITRISFLRSQRSEETN